MTKGMNEYTMTYLDNNEQRQTRRLIASNYKQAVITAEQYLLKNFGFNCLLRDVEEVTDPAQTALCDHISSVIEGL